MKINLISEWGNVVSNVRNNIVFEHRNQAYGAYFIRREYPRTMFFSLFVTVSIIGFLVLGLKLNQYFKNEVPEVIIPDTYFKPEIEVEVNLKKEKPVIIENEQQKPSKPPKGFEHLAPVVSDDKDTITETQPFNPDLKPGKPDGVDTDTLIEIPDTKGKGIGTIVAVDTVEKIIDFPDVNPEFPGGLNKMYDFISDKLKYPKMEKDNDITGTVYIGFVVDKSGKIKDVTIERGVKHGPNLAIEAQRVINMMPEWKPGMIKGQPVSVRYHIPIKFVLQ